MYIKKKEKGKMMKLNTWWCANCVQEWWCVGLCKFGFEEDSVYSTNVICTNICIPKKSSGIY